MANKKSDKEKFNRFEKRWTRVLDVIELLILLYVTVIALLLLGAAIKILIEGGQTSVSFLAIMIVFSLIVQYKGFVQTIDKINEMVNKRKEKDS